MRTKLVVNQLRTIFGNASGWLPAGSKRSI
jgi:hypothetical protein